MEEEKGSAAAKSQCGVWSSVTSVASVATDPGLEGAAGLDGVANASLLGAQNTGDGADSKDCLRDWDGRARAASSCEPNQTTVALLWAHFWQRARDMPLALLPSRGSGSGAVPKDTPPAEFALAMGDSKRGERVGGVVVVVVAEGSADGVGVATVPEEVAEIP